MGETLFDIPYHYTQEFERAWECYRYKRCKDDAFKAWGKMKPQLPDKPLLHLCIDEYLIEMRKLKQHQAHFASWLRARRWLDFIDDAKLRRARIGVIAVRRAFKASDYDIPIEQRAKRTAAEILADYAKRNSQERT